MEAKKLQATINKANGNYYVLSVYKLSALYDLAKLVNGKFRTPKIEALHRLIDWLNNTNKFDKLEGLPLDDSDLTSNSWFAGFSDSDSNFKISFNLWETGEKRGIAKNISFTYQITQRQQYHRTSEKFSNSYLHIMSLIGNSFNKRVEIINRSRINPKTGLPYVEQGYAVKIRKKSSILDLIKYFDQFPLLSSKHLDYLD